VLQNVHVDTVDYQVVQTHALSPWQAP